MQTRSTFETLARNAAYVGGVAAVRWHHQGDGIWLGTGGYRAEASDPHGSEYVLTLPDGTTGHTGTAQECRIVAASHAQKARTTDEHRELFPLSGYTGAAGMRRISVVCDVQSIAKCLWSWPPVRGAETLGDAIAENLRHSQPSPDIRLAIDEYFEAYAPLKTNVRAMDTDARRAFMAQIIADAREDEVKYRKRMNRIGGLQ